METKTDSLSYGSALQRLAGVVGRAIVAHCERGLPALGDAESRKRGLALARIMAQSPLFFPAPQGAGSAAKGRPGVSRVRHVGERGERTSTGRAHVYVALGAVGGKRSIAQERGLIAAILSALCVAMFGEAGERNDGARKRASEFARALLVGSLYPEAPALRATTPAAIADYDAGESIGWAADSAIVAIRGECGDLLAAVPRATRAAPKLREKAQFRLTHPESGEPIAAPDWVSATLLRALLTPQHSGRLIAFGPEFRAIVAEVPAAKAEAEAPATPAVPMPTEAPAPLADAA